MSEQNKHARYFNYPQAQRGPTVPYQVKRRPNPVITGPFLVIAAFLMEWVRFIRETAWKNAGFGSIRKIRGDLLECEPRYKPTVIPVPLDPAERTSENQKAQLSELIKDPSQALSRNHAGFYSVADYHALYLSGEVTPTDVAQAILPLIRRDTSPPGKHSIAWFESKVNLILDAAEASTKRYKEGRSLGPLDGVPTAVKDEYDADGYATCLGSKIDFSPSEPTTSWLVHQFEEAGVVNLGKLSMHEFGLDTNGNNPVHGTPPNPFNPNYYTGGSSSGSGYAVGSGLIPIALGSDGGGSIRIPSSYCSIFGLKTTHDRLSTWPGINHSPTCGVLGPMAVDMQSLAIAYEALAESHPTTEFPPLILQPAPVMAKVLGIYDAWFSRADKQVQKLVRGLIDTLTSKHGYSIVPIEIPFVTEGQVAHALTVLTDAATLLDDTRDITPANKILLSLGRTTPSTDYLLAQKLRGLLMQHLAHLWKTYPGMVIITPTTACAGWPIRSRQNELKYGLSDGSLTIESMEYVWLANFCGLPSLTVPAGYVVPGSSENGTASATNEGLVPVGLMATGEWCSENALIKFGFDAEVAGQEQRCKPPIWEDIIGRAKTVASNSSS